MSPRPARPSSRRDRRASASIAWRRRWRGKRTPSGARPCPRRWSRTWWHSRPRSNGCASRYRTLSERLPSLVVVFGPSGAGKSTILARVLEEMRNLRFSVSHTTRQAREGETEGVHYHFVDRPTFEGTRERKLFLESAEVHGQLYGTSRAEYDRASADGVDLLLDLDVQGAAQVREAFPDAVSVYTHRPTYTALQLQLH